MLLTSVEKAFLSHVEQKEAFSICLFGNELYKADYRIGSPSLGDLVIFHSNIFQLCGLILGRVVDINPKLLPNIRVEILPRYMSREKYHQYCMTINNKTLCSVKNILCVLTRNLENDKKDCCND